MIKLFLGAKHWQLFVLLLVPPIFFQMVLMASLFASVSTGDEASQAIFGSFILVYPLIMVLVLGVLYGWYWSVAMGLKHKLPAEVELNYKRFKLLFFLPLVYILGFVAVMGLIFTTMASGDLATPPFWLILMIPLHLFAMFCIFYSMYFVAKTIKAVELQRHVQFSEFLGEFFMIWFFPIGVWILQPKINRLVEEETHTNPNNI